MQSEPERVFNMLAPFLDGDPDGSYCRMSSSERIAGAFHGQNWSNRGFLTRKEVTVLCQGLMVRAGVFQDMDRLQTTVFSYDANMDNSTNLSSQT